MKFSLNLMVYVVLSGLYSINNLTSIIGISNAVLYSIVRILNRHTHFFQSYFHTSIHSSIHANNVSNQVSKVDIVEECFTIQMHHCELTRLPIGFQFIQWMNLNCKFLYWSSLSLALPDFQPDLIVVAHSNGPFNVSVCLQSAEQSEMSRKLNFLSRQEPYSDATMSPILGCDVIPDIKSTATDGNCNIR